MSKGSETAMFIQSKYILYDNQYYSYLYVDTDCNARIDALEMMVALALVMLYTPQ